MVQETKRFLSYICPRCMQSVIVERDLFSLAAAPARIKCPCGKSELGVEFMPDRVKLTVPCLFCGREHSVSCSSMVAFNRFSFRRAMVSLEFFNSAVRLAHASPAFRFSRS